MDIIQKITRENILADTHSHFSSLEFDDSKELDIKRALDKNVRIIIDVATDFSTTKKVLENARNFDEVFSTIGIHPEVCVKNSDLYASQQDEILNNFYELKTWFEELSRADRDLICMVGETGIDTFWMQKNEVESQEFASCLDKQKSLFQKHIDLAIEYNLPLSVHSRNSIGLCFEMLKDTNARAVFHCLTPDIDDNEASFYTKASKILERGFYISINGIITFKNAKILRNTFFKILREKNKQKVRTLADIYNTGFVFETDAPLLAPEGKRGERNEPAYIADIYNFVIENI
jgi:TatD DNase family protein